MKSTTKMFRIVERIAPAIRKYGPLFISAFFAFVTILFVWLVLYKQAGYNETTLMIAQISILMTALSLAILFKNYIGALGLNWRKFVKALIILLAGYVAILIIGFLYDLVLGSDQALLRESYSLSHLLNNWLLTGFGEELLFAGIIYRLLAQKLPPKKTWLCVLIVALLFALWHLPGYIVTGRALGSTLGRMGINFVSWIVLGTIYAFSGNLWLIAAAHGSMDYPLLPRITEQPIFGLIFMGLLILGAWLDRKYFPDESSEPVPAPAPAE